MATIESPDQSETDQLYSLQYLLFKLGQVELTTKALVSLANDTLLCPLLDLLARLAATSDAQSLAGVCSLTMKLIGSLSRTFLGPHTIKKIFRLFSSQNCLQPMMLKSFTSILTAILADYNLTSTSMVTSRAKEYEYENTKNQN